MVVLWVSRLVPEKRPDIWLRCVKRLQDEGLPVKVIVMIFTLLSSIIVNIYHCISLLLVMLLLPLLFIPVIFLYPLTVNI